MPSEGAPYLLSYAVLRAMAVVTGVWGAMNSAAFAYALLIPLLCGSDAQMTSLRLLMTEGMDARLRVNASSVSARVADAGASTPDRVGGR